MSDAVWITWENQRRSLELSKAFEAKLFLYNSKYRVRPLRYIDASIATVSFVLRERPRLVFGQNPSIALALLLVILKKTFGFAVVIDRHSNFRYGSSNAFVDTIFNYISDYTIRRADVTIVTNRNLKELITAKGGYGVVLQDKIPELSLYEPLEWVKSRSLVFVTSFSKDEPLEEILEVAKKLPSDIDMYITGNYIKSSVYKAREGNLSSNVHFTGFLPEKDYQSLLYSSDAVIVLTKSENTLTCGAYEAVALGKAMVLSDKEVLRQYFSKGAVYTDNSVQSLHESILLCLQQKEKLETEVVEFRAKVRHEWQQAFETLDNEIKTRLKGTGSFASCAKE